MKPATPQTESSPPTQLRKVVFGGSLMRKLKLILGLPFLLALAACSTMKNPSAASSGATQTVRHFSLTQTLSLDYLLFLPADYAANSGKRWPLIFFLHGSGARGSNVWKVARNGLPKKIGRAHV